MLKCLVSSSEKSLHFSVTLFQLDEAGVRTASRQKTFSCQSHSEWNPFFSGSLAAVLAAEHSPEASSRCRPWHKAAAHCTDSGGRLLLLLAQSSRSRWRQVDAFNFFSMTFPSRRASTNHSHGKEVPAPSAVSAVFRSPNLYHQHPQEVLGFNDDGCKY